jgi:hypothetical protein
MGQMGDTSINLFHPNSQSLPAFQGNGSVFVLRRARVQAFQNKLQCVSIKGSTTWAVIPSRSSGNDSSDAIIPVNIAGMVLSLDEKDRQVIRILQDWLGSKATTSNPIAMPGSLSSSNNFLPSGKCLRTIAQINRPGLFLDLIAEVCRFLKTAGLLSLLSIICIGCWIL